MHKILKVRELTPIIPRFTAGIGPFSGTKMSAVAPVAATDAATRSGGWVSTNLVGARLAILATNFRPVGDARTSVRLPAS